jgi:SMI1 / KNR4 family (SUKH-1)
MATHLLSALDEPQCERYRIAMHASPGQRLKSAWSAAGPPRPGATESALADFESRQHIVLPADFRSYLAIVDGGEDVWVGGVEITFWSLCRIEVEMRDWECFEPGIQGTLLPFADWLINSHVYAIRVSTDPAPPVFRIYGRDKAPVPCADSFAEFVSLYESGDSRLY